MNQRNVDEQFSQKETRHTIVAAGILLERDTSITSSLECLSIYVNEQSAFFNQRLQGTHRRENLTRDDEKDRSESIVNPGFDGLFQSMEDQTGE